MPLLEKRYIETGKVRYIYRPLIWDTEELNGRLAAEALYCAGDQGKFWEMHDWMFNNVDRWGQDPDLIGVLDRQAVPELGLDGKALRSCLEAETYKEKVVALTNDAKSRGITSTPTFLVNDTLLVGMQTIAQFGAAIEGNGQEFPPGLKLALAIAGPALLGLLIGGGSGPRVTRPVLRLRMVIGGLALLGLLVASYLALFELRISGSLVCPLGGECAQVNRSDYVNMLGIPVALVGVIGYSLILALTLAQMTRRQLWGIPIGPILIGLGGIGVAFSLFLTYLEVFVIRSICTWCAASALLMVGILGVSIAAWIGDRQRR